MHVYLEGAPTIAVLDGRIGPLPLTGYDLLAIAGVASVMAVAALILQRVAARGRPSAPARRSHLDHGGRRALDPAHAVGALNAIADAAVRERFESRLAELDLLERRAADDALLGRLLVAEIDADHAAETQLNGAAEDLGPPPDTRFEQPLGR